MKTSILRKARLALAVLGCALIGAGLAPAQAQTPNYPADALPARARASKTAPKLSAAAQKRFQSQIGALQTFRRTLSPAQKKISNAFLFTTDQARALRASAPRLANGIQSAPNAMTKTHSVFISGTMTTRLKIALEKYGVLLGFHPQDHMAHAQLSLAAMEKIAALNEVSSIIAAIKPQVNGGESKGVATPQLDLKSSAGALGRSRGPQPVGSLNSEGDATHRANFVRSNYGVNGSGVKVGLISDSVDNLAAAQASGNLPAIQVIAGRAGKVGQSGEGTAMLEIVHDLAPGAQLAFACAFGNDNSPSFMADSIRLLAAAGCDIIVDDLAHFFIPIYQEDVVSKAIREVTAQGVVYVTCASNYGNVLVKPTGSWEGDFEDSAFTFQTDKGVYVANNWAANDDNAFNTIVTDAQTVSILMFRWAEPWGKSKVDYDIYLLDASGNVKGASTFAQNGDDLPAEFLQLPQGVAFENGDAVVVARPASAAKLPISIFCPKASIEFSQGATIYGHNGCEQGITAGAAPAASPGPFPNPFTSTSPLEDFSSAGPRILFFTPTGAPLTKVNLKPDVIAADKVACVTPKFNPFFGTSAAAPHVAAIAALMLSSNPSLTVAQVKARMNAGTLDVGTAGWNADSGYGIVMAPLAVPIPAPLPTLSINNVSRAEGNSNSSLSFTVSLSAASSQTVTVKFATANGTASASSDYTAMTGTVTFAPGQTSRPIAVTIVGDSVVESNETFVVNLSNPGGATLSDAQGTATLTNDDAPPANSTPQSVSANPSSGTSQSSVARTVRVVYSDANGNADISQARILINASANGANALYGFYDAVANRLYLFNDAGTKLSGGFAPGSDASIPNSQGTLNCAQTTVARSGNTLTVNWNFTPNGFFVGAKTIYGRVSDKSGATQGLKALGSWTIALNGGNDRPLLQSLSPASGTSQSSTARTLSFTYGDPDGQGDIAQARVVIGANAAKERALYGFYDALANKLFLYDDSGTKVVGGFAPGSNNAISNTQGTLNCAQTTVERSGNSLTVNWNFTPNGLFVGTKRVYGYVRDKALSFDGFRSFGTWVIAKNPVNDTPVNRSVTPSAATGVVGQSQTLRANYSDPDGAGDIAQVRILVNSTLSGANALYGLYNRATNKLYLFNDAGNALLGGFAPGSANVIPNSQGTLNCAQTTIVQSGTVLGVNWNFTPKAAFAGNKKVFLFVRDAQNTTDGFDQMATWNIAPAPLGGASAPTS